MKKNKSKKGFTLIEVMIVVAIIGIIAAIAYPSYMTSVRKSNRTEAKTELYDVAQRLQRCYTTYARFDSNQCAVYTQLTTGAGFIPSQGRGFYQITISDDTRTTYTLTATAVLAPQTGDVQDGCNVMTLNHQGTSLPDVCW